MTYWSASNMHTHTHTTVPEILKKSHWTRLHQSWITENLVNTILKHKKPVVRTYCPVFNAHTRTHARMHARTHAHTHHNTLNCTRVNNPILYVQGYISQESPRTEPTLFLLNPKSLLWWRTGLHPVHRKSRWRGSCLQWPQTLHGRWSHLCRGHSSWTPPEKQEYIHRYRKNSGSNNTMIITELLITIIVTMTTSNKTAFTWDGLFPFFKLMLYTFPFFLLYVCLFSYSSGMTSVLKRRKALTSTMSWTCLLMVFESGGLTPASQSANTTGFVGVVGWKMSK